MVSGLLPHHPTLWVAVLALHSAQSTSRTPTFSCTCPWTTGLLVLTTYCPPSRYDSNIPFSVHWCQVLSSGSSRALCIFLLSCLAPSSRARLLCTEVWTPAPEGQRVPGRQGRCLPVPIPGNSHSCCRGNVEGEAVLSLSACSLLSPCRSLSQAQVEEQRLPPGLEASALQEPERSPHPTPSWWHPAPLPKRVITVSRNPRTSW